MNQFPRPNSSATKLLSFMVLWMVVAMGYSLVQSGVLVAILGKDAASQLLNNPEMIAENRLLVSCLQMGYTLGLFLLPALVFAALQRVNVGRFYRLNRLPPPTLIMLGAASIVFAVPFILSAHELNLKLPLPDFLTEREQSMEQMLEVMLHMDGIGDLLFNLVLVAVLPAIAEEVFFRGGLQRLFQRTTGNADAAIVVTAIVFSAVHMQFTGFIPRMILGILFGYMFYWSRNLWVPIAVHAFYNGFQVVLYYLSTREGAGFTIEDSEHLPIWASLISVVLMFLILRQFYNRAVLRNEIMI